MFTIGAVARRAGLRPSAIRYYEQQGLIPAPARRGGKRIYDSMIWNRLALIILAKSAGFTLEEIRSLVTGKGRRPAALWNRVTAAKRADLDAQISRLVARKALFSKLERCVCATLEECGRAFAAER